MNNTDKQIGLDDILLDEMMRRIIENPERILVLDYEMVCNLVFMLFCKGYLDVAEICVVTLSKKYGDDKVYHDLTEAAHKTTEELLLNNALEKLYKDAKTDK